MINKSMWGLMIVAFAVLTFMFSGCGDAPPINIVNTTTADTATDQTSTQDDLNGNDAVAGDDCSIQWGYTTPAHSGIEIVSCDGGGGTYTETCNGTETTGTFTCPQENLDLCAGTHMLELECGYTVSIQFDS